VIAAFNLGYRVSVWSNALGQEWSFAKDGMAERK
jgi:hypothetical protein